MRTIPCTALACGLALVLTSAGWAGDADAHALIEKAIKSRGDFLKLGKNQAVTLKLKGTIQIAGMAAPFSAELAKQGLEQSRAQLEVEINGQKLHLVSVMNRDKGWIKLNDKTMPMDKDKLAEAKEEAYAGWVESLLPLRDKQFTLSLLGEVKVKDKNALGVRVSSKGHRDINLYFDKTTYQVLKTERIVKDDSGQEVTHETIPEVKLNPGAAPTIRLTVRRDGKLHLEGEVTDLMVVEKLDDSIFGPP